MAFLPAERGYPEKSIALYRNGEQVLYGSSHKSKRIDFSGIENKGITVEKRFFTENRQNIEARIEKLDEPKALRIFLLSKPVSFKQYDFSVRANLPAFWVSSEIPQSEIEADFRAIVENGIGTDKRVKSIEISFKRMESIPVLHENSMPILDQKGVPVTMGDSISFYRPRVDISCTQKTDCQDLKKIIAGFADDIR